MNSFKSQIDLKQLGKKILFIVTFIEYYNINNQRVSTVSTTKVTIAFSDLSPKTFYAHETHTFAEFLLFHSEPNLFR